MRAVRIDRFGEPARPFGGEILVRVVASAIIALAWCAGILIVAYAFAMNTYRRKISSAEGLKTNGESDDDTRDPRGGS
ncbi:hypothetical protein OUY22_14035 [Nonomuraea sp. MCN248]|uniref:Uncharacterized protein n=1 Tax=Nonomuraea corallina TaxID=2989783 RepID=A0ABT4SBK9_9ACTN|nr:hypothetical protein [Nonomuraea corallina]MDA0634540.1 hypothetical protein [Nonomuraea corallina]